MICEPTVPFYQGKLAVLDLGQGDASQHRQLARKLSVPLYTSVAETVQELFFLTWREGALRLIDRALLKKGGMTVEINPRNGEQWSWPAPKRGPLAQALGRKTVTVVDATTGWGQDGLALFRMGYRMQCIERSPVMAELLADGFSRLAQQNWMQTRQLQPPQLIIGDAITALQRLTFCPDCIFLDPMFPPKRKKSALAKKPIEVLRVLLGDDPDKQALFDAAVAAAGQRVVVKSPDDAAPLGGKADASFQGKLLRYDVYFKSPPH